MPKFFVCGLELRSSTRDDIITKRAAYDGKVTTVWAPGEVCYFSSSSCFHWAKSGRSIKTVFHAIFDVPIKPQIVNQISGDAPQVCSISVAAPILHCPVLGTLLGMPASVYSRCLYRTSTPKQQIYLFEYLQSFRYQYLALVAANFPLLLCAELAKSSGFFCTFLRPFGFFLQLRTHQIGTLKGEEIKKIIHFNAHTSIFSLIRDCFKSDTSFRRLKTSDVLIAIVFYKIKFHVKFFVILNGPTTTIWSPPRPFFLCCLLVWKITGGYFRLFLSYLIFFGLINNSVL